jgi:hypothetical protein
MNTPTTILTLWEAPQVSRGSPATPELARTCREPGCQRSTDWPHDPDLLAAYCREHTDGLLLPPREPSTWVRLALEHRLPSLVVGGVSR